MRDKGVYWNYTQYDRLLEPLTTTFQPFENDVKTLEHLIMALGNDILAFDQTLKGHHPSTDKMNIILIIY